MVVNKLLNNLTDIGFTEYEAKAYAALIADNPVTAYELSKASGIPSSKIYEVLSRLIEKEAILALDHDNRKRYVPVDPDEYIDERKNILNNTINALKHDLKKLSGKQEISYIWNLHDYVHLIAKAENILQKAKSEILLSAWPQEIKPLEKILEQKARNINISIVHFGEIRTDSIGRIFQHPIEDTIFAEKGGRGFAIVADSQSALIGTVLNDGLVEGAWSSNNGFVTLAEDYIKHDIYIMKIVKRFDKLLIKRFGPNYMKLRDVFNDEEEKQ